MFGKINSAANLCTALILCTIFGMASAAPVQLENALRARDLQPITPTSQIQPGMFDLLDQYRNLAQQAAAVPKGTPQYTALITKMNSTKAQLETTIQGVAVLAADPSTTSTNATSSTIAPTTTPTPSAATTVTTTVTASPGSKSESARTTSSLTTASPTVTDAPPMTIVTQVGTSIVVVASQGVTSTITLATRTTTSGVTTSTSSSSSGATSTFDINTAAAPGTTQAAQSNVDSGAVSLIWSGPVLAACLMVNALMLL